MSLSMSPRPSALSALFGEGAEIVKMVPELVDEQLFPEELALVVGAVPKRRAEFGTGGGSEGACAPGGATRRHFRRWRACADLAGGHRRKHHPLFDLLRGRGAAKPESPFDWHRRRAHRAALPGDRVARAFAFGARVDSLAGRLGPRGVAAFVFLRERGLSQVSISYFADGARVLRRRDCGQHGSATVRGPRARSGSAGVRTAPTRQIRLRRRNGFLRGRPAGLIGLWSDALIFEGERMAYGGAARASLRTAVSSMAGLQGLTIQPFAPRTRACSRRSRRASVVSIMKGT